MKPGKGAFLFRISADVWRVSLMRIKFEPNSEAADVKWCGVVGAAALLCGMFLLLCDAISLNFKPGTRKLETRNLKPETRNPNPETRNSKPET